MFIKKIYIFLILIIFFTGCSIKRAVPDFKYFVSNSFPENNYIYSLIKISALYKQESMVKFLIDDIYKEKKIGLYLYRYSVKDGTGKVLKEFKKLGPVSIPAIKFTESYITKYKDIYFLSLCHTVKRGRSKEEVYTVLKYDLPNDTLKTLFNNTRFVMPSLDGKKIAFVRGKAIWTANFDGSKQKRYINIPNNLAFFLWKDDHTIYVDSIGSIFLSKIDTNTGKSQLLMETSENFVKKNNIIISYYNFYKKLNGLLEYSKLGFGNPLKYINGKINFLTILNDKETPILIKKHILDKIITESKMENYYKAVIPKS